MSEVVCGDTSLDEIVDVRGDRKTRPKWNWLLLDVSRRTCPSTSVSLCDRPPTATWVAAFDPRAGDKGQCWYALVPSVDLDLVTTWYSRSSAICYWPLVSI